MIVKVPFEKGLYGIPKVNTKYFVPKNLYYEIMNK